MPSTLSPSCGAGLQVVSHANPLRYQVDALRALMLSGGTSSYGVGVDLLILAAVTGVMIGVASFQYTKIVI